MNIAMRFFGMPKACVCRVCDEVSWIYVSPPYSFERTWITCMDCIHKRSMGL